MPTIKDTQNGRAKRQCLPETALPYFQTDVLEVLSLPYPEGGLPIEWLIERLRTEERYRP
jgi:hypothetical protein